MDSLLASYASSDEEEIGQRSQRRNLPSIPPRSQVEIKQRSDGQQLPKFSSDSSLPAFNSKTSSSLFAALPQPKARNSVPAAKRVVQFRPPPMDLLKNSGDDDDDDDKEEEEKKKEKQRTEVQTSSAKSLFLSMPAPKSSATLGVLPSASGTGRRSMLETNVPATSDSSFVNTINNEGGSVAVAAPPIGGNAVQSSMGMGDPIESSGYAGNGDYANWLSGSENYVNYDGNDGAVGGYYDGAGASGDYGNYGSGYVSTAAYGQNESDAAVASVESAVRMLGKRGRNEVPAEIIEVNQDELMKNRPREDQAKSTGIAFGPSYQPVSTKGKPSKLHKRKHQIGALFFDMKQKEMELAERRSRGLLTKTQTHAKYGWS